MFDMAETKKEIRKKLSLLRNELNTDYKEKSDSLIFNNVINSEAYFNSKIMLAFYPIKSEPQILPIIFRALEDGKRVAFPICNTEDHTLTFKYITDFSQLEKGAYSIYEPIQSCQIYNLEQDALCLVPALAFDSFGRRIGYGKGYYDRFLSTFNGVTVGICYSALLVDSLPYENTDVPVDIIITEEGEININAI